MIEFLIFFIGIKSPTEIGAYHTLSHYLIDIAIQKVPIIHGSIAHIFSSCRPRGVLTSFFVALFIELK